LADANDNAATTAAAATAANKTNNIMNHTE